jgi:hypothetical protein
MLKLEKRAETRVPLDDAGACIILDPITPKMRRRVFRMYREALEKEGVDPIDAAKNGIGDADLTRDLAELISGELIRMGARIRTATDPERPTGTIDTLLTDEAIFEKIDAGYVVPDSIRRAEKNGLSGSPTGTSKAATPARIIADSRAKPKKTAAAKNAPTANSSRKRKTAKGSGKS